MKVAIFQSDMKVGGIQRALITLLTSDVLAKAKVDLYLFDGSDDYDLSKLPSNVCVTRLQAFPYFCKVVPFDLLRLLYGRRALELGEYDVAVDFNGYWSECSVFATSIKATKKVVWVHNDFVERSRFDKKFRLMLGAFKSKYALFDEVVAVSQGALEALISIDGVSVTSGRAIPNLIDVEDIRRKSMEPVDFSVSNELINFVCVGRVDSVKGVPELIEIFERVLDRGKNARLYILGKGGLLEELQALVDSKCLGERIIFLGQRTNPYPYMRQMDALVLNSKYEGQGIVIREAQALGLDAIFPQRLEKYNMGLCGCADLEEALYAYQPSVRKTVDSDVLGAYNNTIRAELHDVFYTRTSQVN